MKNKAKKPASQRKTNGAITNPNPSSPSDTPKRTAFLAAFAKLGNITAAAAASGCSTSSHRETWIHDPEYMKQFEAAKHEARERLESFAIQRATRADKPSDLLLIFLLKAAWPDKYREKLEHTGTFQHEVKMYGQEAPVNRV